MAAGGVTKCLHPPCNCNVEIEERYCSEACASAIDQPLVPCPCGHPECVGVEDAVDREELDDVPTT
ncbi:MAG TPA: hypothetical protein VG272_11445 [Candidatus Acidoferrales bacterium]|nr:hypothetical protein [Candidatus Acidoferrales bacterium]